MQTVQYTYVLITPARNEAAHIERTIKSVIAQTVRPIKWVIVNDGSTDETEWVVRRYMAQHNWIHLLSLPARSERNFAGKVQAFNAGYEVVRNSQHDVVGNLDGDLEFGSDNFEFLMKRFQENPKLGVAGFPFSEGGTTYDFRFVSTEHVSGACQMFRRECFEDIGGYTPIREGGIDLVAVITARMKGWQTRTYTERVVEHLKPTQCKGKDWYKQSFRSGYHDYLMGNPLIWQVARSTYQLTKRPYAIGGSMLLAGYIWAVITRVQRPVPKEFVLFRAREQRQRLRNILRSKRV